MSIENSKARLQDNYPYHIVEFISRGRKPQKRKLDIVATKWLTYDHEKKKVLVSYPPTPFPYSSEQYDAFLDELQDPPDGWILYTVVLVGRAVSLEEALVKFQKLNESKSVLTMSSNESDREAEKKAASLVRQDQLKEMSNKMKRAHENSLEEKKRKTDSSSQCVSKTVESPPLSRSGSYIPKINSLAHQDPEKYSPSVVTPEDNSIKFQQRKLDMSSSPTTSMASETPLHLRRTFSDLTNVNTKTARKLFHQATHANDKHPIHCQSTGTNDTLNETAYGTNSKLIQEMLLTIQSDIREMKKDMKVMNSDIQTIKNSCLKKAGTRFIGTVQQLIDKYTMDIPFKIKEEFLDFDNRIGIDASFRENVSCVLETGMDPALSISKSIVQMMKMFLTKAVAVQYVAIKKVEHKGIMKNTRFFKLIEMIIKERRKLSQLSTTDKEISTALSNVLSNAVAWHKDKSQVSKMKLNKSSKNGHESNIVHATEVVESVETEQEDNIEGLYTVLVDNSKPDEPPMKVLRKDHNLGSLSSINGMASTSSTMGASLNSSDIEIDGYQDMSFNEHTTVKFAENKNLEISSEDEFDEDYLKNFST